MECEKEEEMFTKTSSKKLSKYGSKCCLEFCVFQYGGFAKTNVAPVSLGQLLFWLVLVQSYLKKKRYQEMDMSWADQLVFAQVYFVTLSTINDT